MKKNCLFFTLIVPVTLFFLSCNNPPARAAVEEMPPEEYEAELSPLVKPADLRSRPDIILNAYLAAYPDKIKAVVPRDGDWALELLDGSLYYWAEGKLLPPDKRAQAAEYRAHQIYPYRGLPRNPETYTGERIEALRKMGSREVRSAVQPPQEAGFMRSLYGVGTRAETEAHIVKTVLFGKRVSVHRMLVPALKRVDEQVRALAAVNSEVADFLASLVEVGGYSWRTVAGTNRPSNHSYGLALDILPKNWRNKAMYWGWISDFNEDWMLWPQERLWTPPEPVIEIFRENGFIWGGTWDIYDTMHFEYKPELIELGKSVIFN